MTSSPERRYYWEDFPVGHRRDFGGLTVEREEVIAFAGRFDPQPFHVDDEAARRSIFGRLATSGWHTCALAMRMMCDAYLLEAASMGSPGVDSVRWLRPVYPGDTLRVRLEVLEARPMASRPAIGLVRSRWEVYNQQGEDVLTMEGWGMFARRPTVTPQDVLDFWFGTEPQAARAEWFRKDDAFDARIRERFGVVVETALAGMLPPEWFRGATPRLAQLLLLDQFTRNAFRGGERAFAGDAQALALSAQMVDEGMDRELAPLQRWFVYLPFEHAEDLAQQDRSVALFAALADAAPGMDDALDYAHRHRDVIRRFGRFPHRNAQLGRASTPEEQAYLAQPGSGF